VAVGAPSEWGQKGLKAGRTWGRSGRNATWASRSFGETANFLRSVSCRVAHAVFETGVEKIKQPALSGQKFCLLAVLLLVKVGRKKPARENASTLPTALPESEGKKL